MDVGCDFERHAAEEDRMSPDDSTVLHHAMNIGFDYGRHNAARRQPPPTNSIALHYALAVLLQISCRQGAALL